MNIKISVVLASFNEEKLLPRCLESLNKQLYPKDKFEVILVDNGSTDKTAEIAKKAGIRYLHYTEIQGCGASRQFGAENAKGSIIAFTDPDTIVPNNWLEKIDKELSDPSIVCIGGQARPDKDSPMQNVLFGFYNLFHKTNHYLGKPIIWGFNMAIKKEQYNQVGGINKNLLSSDDWDLALRLRNKFGKQSIKYVPELIAFTSIRKNDKPSVFLKYAKNGVINYVDMVILGRIKARPVFNVR